MEVGPSILALVNLLWGYVHDELQNVFIGGM